MASAQDSRAALLEAGLYLAERMPLAQVNGALIAQAAGLAPHEFEQQFTDLDQYLLILQERFMDDLRSRVVQATAQTAPGVERLKCAIETYLDVCLEHFPLRAWLVEKRYTNAVIGEALRQRNRGYVHLITHELGAMGWRHASEAARLLMAMSQEASLAEHQARRKLPDYRAALADFLSGPPL
ncbi:MAG: TetR/AcrR family transcriptional regulator [Nevskiales bacterium]